MPQLACALWLLQLAAANPLQAPPREPDAPAEIEVTACFARETQRITDGVWVLAKPHPTDAPFEGNTTVVEQQGGFVVVDAGGSFAAGASIVRAIRALGPKPVHTLIYTHYHGDHTLGAAALRAAWPGLRVVSTEPTRVHMTGAPMEYVHTYAETFAQTVAYAEARSRDESVSAAEREGWARMAAAGPCLRAGYADPVVVPANVTFADRITIQDEVAPVQVRFLGRANTDGDAIVWLPRQRVLVTGDVVVHPIPYASACYPAEWCGVLEQLESFDFAWLVPGHGAVQADTEYLRRLRKCLVDVRADVGRLAAEGLDLEGVRSSVDSRGIRLRFVADEDAWGRVVFANVFLGAVLSNAWREARGEPIVQGREGG